MSIEAAFDEFPPAPSFFCKTFFRFVHCIDDVWDKDKEVLPETLSSSLVAFISQLSTNPFWLQHQAQLMPIVHSAAAAWAASERLRKSEDIQNKLAAEVLKSQYFDVFAFVALLVGGSEFANNWDKKYRSYSFG